MAAESIKFVVHNESFGRILGSNPSAKLLAESTDGAPLFHEACIYHVPSCSVFVTSNQISNSNGTAGKTVKLTQISLNADEDNSSKVTTVTPSTLAGSFLNGGVNYGGDLLMCAQGSLDPNAPSGLVVVPASDPSTTQLLLTSFHGIPFNSVNDVVIHPDDGSVWFTDPCYGHGQGIRPQPQLPNQVYRFDPKTLSIRAVADGFTRPNGICFAPGAKIVYVTDTGAIHGSPHVAPDLAGASHIYAFDLVEGFLMNRRLFAYAPGRFPDGIKCDMDGNVYAGCGDGVNVWNEKGTLLGVIKVGGGVANFCFGEKGAMFLCNETRFWQVDLDGDVVKGALLGI